MTEQEKAIFRADWEERYRVKNGSCVMLLFPDEPATCDYCGEVAVGQRCDSCGAPQPERYRITPVQLEPTQMVFA